MPNPLGNVYPGHNAELEASSCHHSLEYSCGIISVTAVQPTVKPFDPYNILDNTEERRMVLGDDCFFRVGDGRHHLKVFRSIYQSIDMALQSMSGQFRVSYISREVKNLLSARDDIMPSRHSNSLSAMFRRDTRFTDLVHFVTNYAVSLKLEYAMQFVQARTSNMAHDMQSSRFIQDASLSTCCRYACIAKLFLKSNKLFMFFTEQKKKYSSGRDLGLIHLYDATLFLSNENDGKLLVMAADCCINKPTLSALFHIESFCNFE